MTLCLIDLADITGGRLRLAAMPPLDGVLARVGRIVLSPDLIEHGDVLWQLTCLPGETETAFLRGAFGVVASGRPAEPWPGCFSLQVDDPLADLRMLVERLDGFEEQ